MPIPARSAARVAALALILGSGLGLAMPGLVAADDPGAVPSPTPLVFHNPQYLVWMDGHGTYNGPVEDNAYWLYISPPDADGNFVVPDGSGGVYHYTGHLVGGPFTGETDACPAMLAAGVTSLQAWVVAAGEDAQVVDCSRYLATEAPLATDAAATLPADDTSGSGGGLPGDEDVDPESLGIAVALIGLLLFGGGAIGLVTGRGTRPLPVTDFGPGGRSDVDTTTRPTNEPPPDPCAEQAADVARASATGRYLNDLLASCRRNEALLQEQIDILANLVLPGSVMLDLGFAAGGLSGGLGGVLGRKLIASETFKRAVGEAVVKDIVKELSKQALGSAGGDIDPGKVGYEGGKSFVKATVLGTLKETIINEHFFDTVYPTAPQKVFRDMAGYSGFMKELTDYGNEVAGPIADGLGCLIDLYEGVSGGLELKARLDQLRALRDRIADKRVELEIRMEDALSQHQYAAERLAHCQKINAPGWRP